MILFFEFTLSLTEMVSGMQTDAATLYKLPIFPWLSLKHVTHLALMSIHLHSSF